MFRGISSATLDSKGRMALPARFREPVIVTAASKLVVTIDMRERCLLMYPLPEWETVQEKLEGLSNIRPDARLLQRLLIGHATDLELDGSGRMLLPTMLREYASLTKGLVLVGQGNKIEIWADAAWKSRMQDWLSDDTADLLADGDEFTGLSV
ncbi:MAG: division/cell wall cluster transcriptional repressor MraZ [Gammaproteobacteria bacterium]|jgi:MraZ protein|nr:division/cell wall cluster transcriptional repressor MraZ [Gammaproteobacteria bacterium]